MSHLPDAVFRTVIAATPLVSIDLLVRRADGCFLVGWRQNRPAARHWFVPGGRVRKGETLATAFARLTAGELGTAFTLAEATLVGAYDHLYPDTVFGPGDGGTHYVVLAHRLEVPADFAPVADAQHERFRWMHPGELRADPAVHPNTRAYFIASN
jgi:colanic acid biosynthesis protein WcaH